MKPTHQPTRANLILRLQDAEDLAAWDEFASIYGPVVFNVATSRGFQAADAENLVQEVL
jgi:RNA polymerase sigma-70 factor (ECF subfamily)